MRILVDTNVFLDLLLPNPEFVEEAKEFFRYCATIGAEIYVTSMSIRDIGYVAHRRLHNKELSRRLQSAVYEICTKVVPLSADATITALYDGRPDFEDSLIMEAADESFCDYIVTRNFAHFRTSKVPAFDVRSFLETAKRSLSIPE
ncbi:MAG: PIN domain-containing protein [Bacilli bacterium]|nr:PIN domain-containing protein [Bacilli bacterium]